MHQYVNKAGVAAALLPQMDLPRLALAGMSGLRRSDNRRMHRIWFRASVIANPTAVVVHR